MCDEPVAGRVSLSVPASLQFVEAGAVFSGWRGAAGMGLSDSETLSACGLLENSHRHPALRFRSVDGQSGQTPLCAGRRRFTSARVIWNSLKQRFEFKQISLPA